MAVPWRSAIQWGRAAPGSSSTSARCWRGKTPGSGWPASASAAVRVGRCSWNGWRGSAMGSDGGSYRHWRYERDKEGIAWLSFDRAERSANALSREVLEELAQLLEEIARPASAGLVIRSGKGSGFIAGADVTEFTTLADAGQALDLIARGQAILDRLAALPFPTLALIDGFCLG